MVTLPHPCRLLVACCSLLLAACAGARLTDDLADYEDALSRLQVRLAQNPNDARALRDAGVVYARTKHFARAGDYLQQSLALQAGDPRTLFYLGLVREALGTPEEALRLYAQYPETPKGSPYRKLMAGRYQELVRRIAHEEIRRQLAGEEERGGEPGSPRVIAVFPPAYRGANAQYEALGRGLAELLMTDLGKVRDLQLVERVRLQVLLDELKLAQTGLVESATAPRVGRLLGAGRLVGGAYDVLPGELLRLETALVAPEDTLAPAFESQSGSLDDVFRIQKAWTFALLDALGVDLTPEEQEQIETVPTRNLQAFLAYARGLQAADAGAYEAAAQYFRQATELDPAFDAAAEQAERAEGLDLAEGAVDEVLVEVTRIEPPTPFTPGLLEDRLRVLNASLGAQFVPGQDTRDPTADAATAGSIALPDPPGPPDF